MGNSQKKEVEEERIEHERLGSIKLELKARDLQLEQEEDEEDCYLMHLTRTIESEKTYNEWLKAMTQLDDSETKEVILLPIKHHFESVGLCGSGGLVKVQPPLCS
jgi:anaerobic ribonucleoside-triphosphate reductase